MEITAELLSFIAGSGISVILSVLTFIPRWQAAWDSFNDKQKQAINGVLVVMVAVAIASLSCFGAVDWIACNEGGLVSLLLSVVAALGGNATMFISTRRVLRNDA